ncbi:MAG TPA: hypothetical protein VFX49_11115 [Chloroflexota bacterium]|nr:hypothetical protein [Chloroflexota bacterium]
MTPAIDRRVILRALPAALLVAGGCGAAEEAPGMDEVGSAMQRSGAAVAARGARLLALADDAPEDARLLLRAAGEEWRAEGAATAAEGARVVRAAEIVGQATARGRRPAEASRVTLSGVEGEAEGLLAAATRLEALSRTLARSAERVGAVLPTGERAALEAEAQALLAVARDARRAGVAMHEQVRRARQSLGERS